MATHRTRDVIAFSVVAGLAGAGIALLFAPRSGEETRQKIKEKKDDIKHQTEAKVDRAKLKMQHSTEKLKAWKEHMARKAREKGEELSDMGSELNDSDSTMLHNWEEEV